MKNIPFIVKIAAKPILILVLLIGLSFIGFSKAFYEIGRLREELAVAGKNENILKSKLDILSTNEVNVEADANYAASFLPGENPALLSLYQLRSTAVANGLFLSSLKVGTGSEDSASGFTKVSISFDTEGSIQQILNFINSTKTIAPNIWIEKTDLNFLGDSLQASIYTKSYSSPFPKKIPALTEAISALDASEKEVLSKISSFSRPSFVSLISTPPRENVNPFGE